MTNGFRKASANDGATEESGLFYCDAWGCDETHPLDHDCLGEPGFGTGRWLGWIYVDLNRPDLMPRPLRFCCVLCAQWWLDRECITRSRRELTPLDEALRAPGDELKRRRAVGERGGQR